ncbi:MAG TPA: hypothetical protein VM101_16395 [Flavitalea sp.]|nr:hypothetical protein [Flavitalea sp.]
MILSGIVEKKKLLLLIALAISIYARAQQFGGNPPSLKWKQINSDTARIIFPLGSEKEAIDVSTLIHDLASSTRKTIGDRTEKINIVLQPLPTTANGYVSLGPFRSEFFLTPQQNSFELGSLPWHKLLALHEYRHVQQYSNFRKGLSKAFYFVFGQEGQAFANSLSIPDWFYEGDAVYQETLLSNQGRGRLPYFFNDYRSLWTSGKNYSWMKLRNGSYRDLVPNHYQLGYMLVSYGYEKYGTDIWRKVTGDAAAFNGLFYPFQKSFKKYSGQTLTSFTKEAMDFFHMNDAGKSDPPSDYGRKHRHLQANEEYPYWSDSNTVIFVKSDFKRIAAFYTRNIVTGKEKRIKLKSVSTDNYFSFSNGRIVYAAYEPHPRWSWKNYEVIKVVDAATGDEKKITRKTRYLSPDISPDGSKIVAVNSQISGSNHLDIVDAINGNVLQSMANPNNYVFTYPKFFKNKIVSPVRNQNGEMALGVFNVTTGNAEWLTPFTMNVISFPQVRNDTVSFTMTEGGHDKLFIAVSGKTMRFDADAQNHSTGDYQLAINNGKYIWSTFTSAGYHLFNGSGKFNQIELIKGENNFYPLHKLEQPGDLISDTGYRYHPIEKYSPSFHLINFHSWRPYISDPEYSYSLIGQNVLNTLQTELYFTYNRNEKFKQTGAVFSYARWYPVISAGGTYTFDRSFTDSSRVIRWNEVNALAGISIPLSFAGGTFLQHLNLSGTFNTKQVYYTGTSKQNFNDKRFNYEEWSVSANNQQIRERQNIFPRFAQSIFARYRHIINTYTAHQLLLNTAIYFPGFTPTHSLVLQASYQQRDTLQQYNFSNSFPISRGYTAIDFPRMWKVGVNYHFPIAYPDLGFGNIIYLLRLRGNAFYDYSKVKSLRTGIAYPFSTLGTELYFDTKWWNQLPLSVGIRYSRLLDNKILGLAPNQYEIILPVNLLSR